MLNNFQGKLGYFFQNLALRGEILKYDKESII